jgi:hypothetical protein
MLFSVTPPGIARRGAGWLKPVPPLAARDPFYHIERGAARREARSHFSRPAGTGLWVLPAFPGLKPQGDVQPSLRDCTLARLDSQG